MKLKFDSCLNHLTRPLVTNEKTYPDRVHCVKCGVHKILNLLFEESDDSAMLNRIKQNIFIYYNRIN